MSEETLNILNELSKKETTDLALNIMELTADNMVKDKEIERLHSIIDFIVESIEDMWVDGFEADNWQYDRKVLNRKEFLDKIKELRGDSNGKD